MVTRRFEAPEEKYQLLGDEHDEESVEISHLWPGAWIKWRPNLWGNLIGKLQSVHFHTRGVDLFSIQRETSRRNKLPRWELHHWCGNQGRSLVARNYQSRQGAMDGAVRFAMNPEHH